MDYCLGADTQGIAFVASKFAVSFHICAIDAVKEIIPCLEVIENK